MNILLAVIAVLTALAAGLVIRRVNRMPLGKARVDADFGNGFGIVTFKDKKSRPAYCSEPLREGQRVRSAGYGRRLTSARPLLEVEPVRLPGFDPAQSGESPFHPIRVRQQDFRQSRSARAAGPAAGSTAAAAPLANTTSSSVPCDGGGGGC